MSLGQRYPPPPACKLHALNAIAYVSLVINYLTVDLSQFCELDGDTEGPYLPTSLGQNTAIYADSKPANQSKRKPARLECRRPETLG